MVRPPPEWTAPHCAQFGLCGGCTLQELTLSAQRAHKHRWALSEVEGALGSLDSVHIHPVRGADEAYGYRNKVELSFGSVQWLSEARKLAGEPLDGRFLGFHAPGRFDRVVDAPRCELVSPAMNQVLAVVREHALVPSAPAPYHPVTHQGFWRHLLLRETQEGVLAVLYTTSPTGAEPAVVEAIVGALADRVAGFQWRINDEVADVARGTLRQAWGRPTLEERLGDVAIEVGPDSFLQTNTAGCVVLYDTVREVIGSGGTLVDLYCGAGAIGLVLASQFDCVVGIEERAAAVQDARANAERNGISATFQRAKVEEVLDTLAVELRRSGDPVHVVVDPPRAGLHPRVAKLLAGVNVSSLVYVACNPASLGRDAAILAEGGWRLTDLHTVDLFPQTGHIEMVGRFERSTVASSTAPLEA